MIVPENRKINPVNQVVAEVAAAVVLKVAVLRAKDPEVLSHRKNRRKAPVNRVVK